MKKKWAVIGATTSLIVVAAGGGYYAMAGKSGADKKADGQKKADVPLQLSALDFTKAGPATIAQTLSISGSVEAARQAVVRSRHAGLAMQMTKRAGETVRQGELLARVDSDDLRLRLGEREASVRQAQAALGVADSARAQQRSLADRGFISKSALDSVESNYVAARTVLETAQSQLTMAKAQLAETALLSPINGVIAKRNVEPGERIGAEMQVFHVIDPSSLELAAQIPAERASELRIGQLATFTADAPNAGGKVEAKLIRIVPNAAAGARTIEARFALPKGTPIPAGAFLSGQLALAQTEVAVAVPRVAVRSDGGGSYVWSVLDGRIARNRVKVIDSDSASDRVAIASGLGKDATVLILRGSEPREGQAVAMPGTTPAVAPPAAAKEAAPTSAPANKT